MSSTSGLDGKASPGKTELKLESVRKGVASVPLQNGMLTVGGVGYTTSQLLAKVDERLAFHKNVHDARLALAKALAERNFEEPETIRFLESLGAAVQGSLGVRNEELVEFGYTPKRPRAQRTVDEKAATVAKAKATRERNHPHASSAGANGAVPPEPPK